MCIVSSCDERLIHRLRQTEHLEDVTSQTWLRGVFVNDVDTADEDEDISPRIGQQHATTELRMPHFGADEPVALDRTNIVLDEGQKCPNVVFGDVPTDVEGDLRLLEASRVQVASV